MCVFVIVDMCVPCISILVCVYFVYVTMCVLSMLAFLHVGVHVFICECMYNKCVC